MHPIQLLYECTTLEEVWIVVASLHKSLDIFQEKMNEFMFGLGFTRVSIDDLLVASEDSFETT